MTETVLAWATLVTRSLLAEAASVLDALGHGDLVYARIVGRDTESLDELQIAER